MVVPGRRARSKAMPADIPRWASFLYMCGYILACAGVGIAITICLLTEFVK